MVGQIHAGLVASIRAVAENVVDVVVRTRYIRNLEHASARWTIRRIRRASIVMRETVSIRRLHHVRTVEVYRH